MELQHTIENLPDHLVLNFTGTLDASTIPQFMGSILQACRDHKPSRMLVDVRQAGGQLQTFDRYKLGDEFSKKFVELMTKEKLPFCRFAVLGNPPLIDPNQFGAVVAGNRGTNAIATTDPDGALRWLMSEPN
jgi:hypothetical protein